LERDESYLNVHDDNSDGETGDVSVLMTYCEGDVSSHKASTVVCQQSQRFDATHTERRQRRCNEARSAGVVGSDKLQQTITTESRHANCSECPSSNHLPEFEHFLTGLQLPSARPITELAGSSDAVDADQLEIERADFQDVVPQFHQHVAWPSTSSTRASSAAFDGKSHCNSTSSRNCRSNISEKSAEVTAVSVSERKDCVVNSNSDVPGSQAAPSAASATEDLSLSAVLQQLNFLSQQLDAQVIR